MPNSNHSRREFLRKTAAAAAFAAAPAVASDSHALASPPATAPALPAPPVHETVTGSGGFPIIESAHFGNVERGDPIPYKQPIEKLREIGMVRETWQLEIIADPKSNSKITHPMLKSDGTALTFDALMKIAATKAVSFFKVMTCNNGSFALGHGLWEGVPLRDVLWLAGPDENVRQVYYYGHHNEDPKQIFKCYLPMNRIFEDLPGELPVILCYKYNGEFLTGQRGGPVRMIIPEAYGFKNVKWLQRIVFINTIQAEDTYAGGNNDTNHSMLKSLARFDGVPSKLKSKDPLKLAGRAQVGVGGLAKVQFWIHREGDPKPPESDPYFTTAPWEDAKILPYDDAVLKGYAGAPLHPAQFDPATLKPREWPIRCTLCRWAAEPRRLAAGKYEVSCRTIDLNGYAQPMPRPFGKSGRNGIQTVSVEVV
jgi:hypothetical protein